MPAGRSLPLRPEPPKGSLPLAPTVPLFQFRLPVRMRPMQGRPLTGMLSAPSDQDATPVYSEVVSKTRKTKQIAIREGDTKWLFRAEGELLEVFDVSTGTDVALAEVPPEIVARGETLLAQFEKSAQRSRTRLSAPETGEVEVDDATQHQLRALGYIE